jgi:hypothetical protein
VLQEYGVLPEGEIQRLASSLLFYNAMAEARGGEKRPVKEGTTLFKGATVVATFSEQGDVKDASIVVDGNVIKWVGPTSELPPEYQNPVAVVDCSDLVVIPGMVNTHHHMYQSLTRCVAQVGPAGSSATVNSLSWSAMPAVAFPLLLASCCHSHQHPTPTHSNRRPPRRHRTPPSSTG